MNVKDIIKIVAKNEIVYFKHSINETIKFWIYLNTRVAILQKQY